MKKPSKLLKLVTIILIFFLIAGVVFYFYFNHNKTYLDNLEDFVPNKYEESTYISLNIDTYYKETILKNYNIKIHQFNDSGKLLHTYYVADIRVTPFLGFQNKTNKLNLMQFNAGLVNGVWEYDIDNNSFKFIEFPENVHRNTGVNFYNFIGETKWLSTLSSHKDGRQDRPGTYDTIINSNCNLDKGYCFENVTKGHSLYHPIVEFDNGSIVVTRIYQNYDKELSHHYRFQIYDENGVILNEIKIEEEAIFSTLYFKRNNELWLIPTMLEDGNFFTYIIREDLSFEKHYANITGEFLTPSGWYQYPLDDNKLLYVYAEEDPDSEYELLFGLQTITIENDGNLSFETYDFDDKYKHINLSIYSIDYDNQEIYAVATDIYNKENSVEIFDFDLNLINSIEIGWNWLSTKTIIDKIN